MLFCFGYKLVAGGDCCVCQKSCITRSCACMYLHKECSKKLLEFYGPNCGICKRKFKTCFLQSCPPETNEEANIVQKSNEIQMAKKRILNMEIKKKFDILAPCILKMYSYLNGARKVNVKLLVNDVCNDIQLKQCLLQNLLSCGVNNTEGKELIEFLMGVNKNYDIFHGSSKKILKKIFEKHLTSSFTWEESCFESF